MDPGTALGIASLVIQLLDGAIKGYGFFLAVGRMDESCLSLRTKLEIEQSKLLGFAQAAGLLDHADDQDLPDSVRADKLVLIAVLNQIQLALDGFAKLTRRYHQLQPDTDVAGKEKALNASVSEAYSSLYIKWDGKAKKRDHARGTNHLIKMYQIGKDTVTDPKRLWWTAFDQKEFEDLLKSLAEYNAFLNGLLQGEYSRKLEKTTQKTYLEMVLVRGKIEELTRLVVSSTLLQGQGHSISTSQNRDHAQDDGKELKVLAGSKIRSLANDEPNGHKPPDYHDIIEVKKLDYKGIDVHAPPRNKDAVTNRERSGGEYRPDSGSSHLNIWIEWKTYFAGSDGPTNRMMPLPENTERIQGLVSLLKSSTLDAFRVPRCIGYFDYCDDDLAGSKHPTLFGIVYEKPGDGKNAADPISLLTSFGQPKPSLTDRVKLAHRIADSLLYLNSVRWFHRSFRSDAVIFHPGANSSLDFTEPYITGFEYARPDSKSGLSTMIPPHPLNELYVHPYYQDHGGNGTYSREFDIYALGIVLLEIAYWQPIRKILAAEFEDAQRGPIAREAKDVRGILLGQKGVKKTYVEDLKAMMGHRYHAAVFGCIDGFLFDDEDEDKMQFSIKLHQRFSDEVVESLKTVDI